MVDTILRLWIFRWSYAFAALLFLIFFRKAIRVRILWMIFWWSLLGLFIRARWREPQQVQVQETLIEAWFDKDIVLVGDFHLGVYKWVSYLSKVVKKINAQEDIDAVLIAWDFTYEPLRHDTESLTELFKPLADLQRPVFAVLGNHDVERPWPDLRNELIKALNTHGVIFLHNDVYRLDGTQLVWLWPHMSQEDDIGLLEQFDDTDEVIVLTHNPDTTLMYTNMRADLTLVWHTHCGQVRLPYIHDTIGPYITPVKGDFDCGWYPEQKLFITKGLGEVALPLRFRNPPTIDVLRIR